VTEGDVPVPGSGRRTQEGRITEGEHAASAVTFQQPPPSSVSAIPVTGAFSENLAESTVEGRAERKDTHGAEEGAPKRKLAAIRVGHPS
jgi:hypothetical protein